MGLEMLFDCTSGVYGGEGGNVIEGGLFIEGRGAGPGQKPLIAAFERHVCCMTEIEKIDMQLKPVNNGLLWWSGNVQ